MKICVTGGAGMIGSHLVEMLVKQGDNVTVIDNFERGNPFNLRLVRNDIRIQKRDLRRESVSFAGYDAVYHLAAKVTGIHYNRLHQLDMMNANLEINTNVAQAVAIGKPGLFTSVSTACVYPHDAPVPTHESCADVCNPEHTNWGYGVAKWVGEQQARFLYSEHGIPTIIVRFFNALGPRDYYDEATSHVSPALIRRIIDGENPCNIWGSGNQSRVLVDARDIAKCLILLSQCQEAQDAQPVNIGHPHEVTIRQLAETICRLSGRSPELVFDTSMPEGYPRRAPDMTRLQFLLGNIEFRSLEDSLRDMLNDYHQQVILGLVKDKQAQARMRAKQVLKKARARASK